MNEDNMQAALRAATDEIIMFPLADTWKIIERVAREHGVSSYALSEALKQYSKEQ